MKRLTCGSHSIVKITRPFDRRPPEWEELCYRWNFLPDSRYLNYEMDEELAQLQEWMKDNMKDRWQVYQVHNGPTNSYFRVEIIAQDDANLFCLRW